jgi:hypothetical protein
MTVTDEIRKTLTDPKPLYALAGAGDLAAEKLKDAPALLTEVAGNVTILANKIAAEAPERIAKVQAKLSEVPASIKIDPRVVLDPKAARTQIRDAAAKADPQQLRDRAQSIALVQVGRMLEAAGKAVETYEGLAERGKIVVDRYRGETPATEVTVVVEQVTVDEPEPVAPAEKPAPVVEDAVVEEPAAPVSPEPTASTAKQPRKATASATTPRKRTSAPQKSTPKA